MREYISLTIEGAPLFKKQTYRFDTPGISVITGLNLNGKADRRAESIRNTNAVGKSLFFSSIKDIAFRSGASGNAKDKPKQGKITLTLKVKGSTWVITRYLKGKSEKFVIEQDGKDKTPVATTEQRALIERVLGRDEETYSVIDYLESGYHLIRSGDTGVRRAFFTKFFNLLTPDRIKKLVEADIARLKTDASLVQELKSQLEGIAPAGRNLKDIQADIDKLQTQREQAEKRVQRLREGRDFAAFVTRYAEVLKLCEDGDDRSHPKDVQLELRKEAKRIRKEIALAEALQDYRADLRAYRKGLDAYNQYLEKFRATPKLMKKWGDDLDEWKAQREFFKEMVWETRARCEREADKIEGIVDELDKAERKLKKLKPNAPCPTCGREMENVHYKEERKRLKAEIEVIARRLEEAKANAKQFIEARDKAISEQKTYASRKDLMQGYEEFFENLPKLPKEPEEPESKEELPERWNEKRANRRLAKLEEDIDTLQSLLAVLPEDLDFPPLTKWMMGSPVNYDSDDYDNWSKKVLKYSTQIAELEQEAEALKQAKANRAKIQARIEELQDGLKDLEVIRIVEQGFVSNAGVKQLQINAACYALEAQVNRYAQYLFPEPYKFEFDLTTQFQILVTRQVSKEQLTSDVRKLSGSEAALFDITLALALISFLPNSRRSNLMILDEMDAKFGPVIEDMFTRFLPKLQQAVPHIVVITPKVDTHYGDAVNYFTVVKQGSVSRLIPGRHVSAANLPKTKPKEAA